MNHNGLTDSTTFIPPRRLRGSVTWEPGGVWVCVVAYVKASLIIRDASLWILLDTERKKQASKTPAPSVTVHAMHTQTGIDYRLQCHRKRTPWHYWNPFKREREGMVESRVVITTGPIGNGIRVIVQ